MVRDVEEQDLGRSDDQEHEQALVARQALLQPRRKGIPDRAEVAERDRRDGTRQRFVAR
jgi:hypothetical protein